MDQEQSVSESRVVSCDMITEEVCDLWLETSAASRAEPGQFVGVYPRDMSMLLPRPISVCDVNEDRMRLVFRLAGGGTISFASLRKGDTVRILGPLGNGYPMDALKGKRVLLLGGGIGIPPLLYLARRIAAVLADSGREVSGTGTGSVTAVLGYRDGRTFLADAFAPYGTVFTASEDGSTGTKGTVLDVCDKQKPDADVICACGPKPMLRAVKEYARARRIAAYLSLEERMACGVGACLGCVTQTKETDSHSHVKNARICTDGPVFPAEAVVFS